MGFQIMIENAGATIACAPAQNILQAEIGAGVEYPYTCATVNCAACISERRSGEVSLLPYVESALFTAQRAATKFLACRARPCSDVEIVWLDRGRT